MGELLDQGSRNAQLMDSLAILDSIPGQIRHPERVASLLLDGANLGAFDVDRESGQGIGERKQESWCVERTDGEAGVRQVRHVDDLDRYREQSRIGVRPFTEGLANAIDDVVVRIRLPVSRE